MTRRKSGDDPTLAVRALRTRQADDVDVYAFFVPGADLLRIAEISRVHRDTEGALHGFQRKEIRNHVQAIVEFLDQGPVLFPNAIILAISPRALFTRSRGGKPEGDVKASESGTLRIPIPRDGSKTAWIVDGQQRSIALAQAQNKSFPVPVVAFVSEDLSVHREQFILVNKARPLPPRLINELLPEVEAELPRDLAPRRIPSELVNRLNTAPDSPFRGLIRRPSEDNPNAVVIDTALIKVVRNSMNSPLGALAPYKASPSRPADCGAMYRVLVAFWGAVREVFSDAWGRSPTESRLMHSAGIEAMGFLMDRVMSRAIATGDLRRHAFETLARIAPHCHWTSGRWPDLERNWNDIQNLNRDIRLLSDQLARLDHAHAFAKVA
ncbi:DGQHR domain-containing protein [Azospirillum melinis]|uniref:DGQHR domain-containing protein n=1 Tax=Azospirillum melinis TaxID=328839 RepID=A0ABX2KUE8_9PROT|nr:DGQHR domain-containing protein DpdB [Azospirillum melinis]MBP2305984.1 DGQHR domain-containing protein [Azospirillum melinis]NUB03489.1 DGQHR domain-containing protein [Azospirillum melinis]